MQLRPIADFEPTTDSRGNEVCPNVLIVNARKIGPGPIETTRRQFHLALWDGIVGFYSVTDGGILHDIDRFAILQIPASDVMPVIATNTVIF